MSTELRWILSILCLFFTALGLTIPNSTVSGVGGGLGIAILIGIVLDASRRQVKR